ncbi:MAG: dockerin type I domain-containing protein [Planctomycetota bacterium]
MVATAASQAWVAKADGYLGPLPYLAFDDAEAGVGVSPFSTVEFDYFYLEDFEDAALNVPGVTLEEPAKIGFPGWYRDSVDADDGVLDGSGQGGHSITSDFRVSSFTFVFDAKVLGEYPTHAGIVWTDVGRNTGGDPFAADRVDNVVFEAFGPTGATLGVYGPFSVGDDSIIGETEEDRFFAVESQQGISRIRLSMPGLINRGADHLQYGRVSPSALTGDYNVDRVVDALDYDVWKSQFGLTLDRFDALGADGNGDGRVDMADFTIWRDNLGDRLPIVVKSASIPEPSTLALAIIGVAVLRRRRFRLQC